MSTSLQEDFGCASLWELKCVTKNVNDSIAGGKRIKIENIY